MRVDKKTAQKNRAHVVDTASKLFRKHGVDGVGIGPLMKQAGLTNGAFYKQFDSKDALVQEATEHALQENRAAWHETLTADAPDPLTNFKNWYLSPEHIEHRGLGCTYSTLATEAPRRDAEFQALFAKAFEASLQVLHAQAPMAREAEIETLCSLVGALTLARAVGDCDLRAEIIEAVTGAARAPQD